MLKQVRLDALTAYYTLLRVLEDCTLRPLRAPALGVRATHQSVCAACRAGALFAAPTPNNGAIVTALLAAKAAGEAALDLERYMRVQANADVIIRETRRAYVALGALAEQTSLNEPSESEGLFTDVETPEFRAFVDAMIAPEALS